MTDLGMMKYFLALEVTQYENGIFISQTKYANDILKILRMMNCNPVVTSIATGTKPSKEDDGSKVYPTLYKRLVGSLMYLTTT